MAGDLDFDATDVPAADPFELLPDGTVVTAVISKSEWKDTKDGDGRYLALEWTTIEGPYEGRKFFDNLNLKNKSEKAVAIAKRMLSAICHAVGRLQVPNAADLEGIPVLLKLGVEPGANGYPAKNRVKDVKPLSDAKPAAAAAATSEKKTAPWGR